MDDACNSAFPGTRVVLMICDVRGVKRQGRFGTNVITNQTQGHQTMQNDGPLVIS